MIRVPATSLLFHASIATAFLAFIACGSRVSTQQTGSVGGVGGEGAVVGTGPHSSVTGTGGDSTAPGTGGAAPECEELCNVAAKCAQADRASCEAECDTVISTSVCGSLLHSLELCFQANTKQLVQCQVSTACTSEVDLYVKCIAQSSPTDAASSSAGAGGMGPGGCDQPGCGFSSTGECSCSAQCMTDVVGFDCVDIPGGAMCSCITNGQSAGMCFDKGGCSTFEGNCCFKN